MMLWIQENFITLSKMLLDLNSFQTNFEYFYGQFKINIKLIFDKLNCFLYLF